LVLCTVVLIIVLPLQREQAASVCRRSAWSRTRTVDAPFGA
jgi:hypothetical protein